MQKLLAEVVRGREHKIILLEVANEAWQNGFPGKQGVVDLREFAKYLGERTQVPVAITSNHDGEENFEAVYAGNVADVATWHFSRDRRTDDGWKPVYDCWDLAVRKGFPPVSSNEPIGPGSSVNAEREPIRLVMAAAFAYAAKLPMYVFHSDAGVLGRTRFEDTPAIDQFTHILRLLPPDLPNWQRSDGREDGAPFVTMDGCVRNTGARNADRFVCVPIGVRPPGLTLQARHALEFTAFNPLTGDTVKSATLRKGERLTVPQGPGALILIGRNRE